MGVETRVNVLFFTDGIKAIFLNKDRKRHYIEQPGTTFTVTGCTFYGGTKYYLRNMKTTYERWKNRWAT